MIEEDFNENEEEEDGNDELVRGRLQLGLNVQK